MTVSYSKFAQQMQVETAFTVLALAKQLKAQGKRIIELEIGDSPFPTTAAAKQAGIAAIEENQTHYTSSAGLGEYRQAAAEFVKREYGIPATEDNVVAAPGAKILELLFCEAFLNPGDEVLVFSPYFPTYLPNIARRGAKACLVPLREENEFRPRPSDVEHFLNTRPTAKGIFLNSPHNPTGGVATEDDLRQIADLIRGRDVVVFSDEPYDRMVWQGRHHSLLAQPEMLDQCVAAYTFSKSYSMSGWRIGFGVGSKSNTRVLSDLINTSLSCVPPIAQMAATAALTTDASQRDADMAAFQHKVARLVDGLNQIEGVHCLMPRGTFYAFPNVTEICKRHGITSHGLALYLLTAADDELGVACLGGESFGDAGRGFLRFSCAEEDELISEAVQFIGKAFDRADRVRSFLAASPQYTLHNPLS